MTAKTLNRTFLTTLTILAFCAPAGQAAAGMKGTPVFTAPYLVNASVEDRAAKAKGVIERLGSEAISFLGSDELTQEQKEEQFEALLNRNFAMDTIGRFSLGAQWKNLDQAQKEEYQDLFEKLIVAIYSNRFSEYKGQAFEVEEVKPTENSDYIVKSYIVPQSGQNVLVEWRVRNKDKQYKIVDVSVEGVSMALTQRSDFASIIQRGGGDPEALLEHLRSRVNPSPAAEL